MTKLDQLPIFISHIIPYDFTKFMNQYAVEINYTSGDTQMLTTKPRDPSRSNDPGDFDTEEEYFKFIEDNKHLIKKN